MKKTILCLAALMMMGTASIVLTSCGDDEPTPQEQQGKDQQGQEGQEDQKSLTKDEAVALLEGQGIWEFEEDNAHGYMYFNAGKMGYFADDATPSELEYELESGSGDFRSGTVRIMEGETLLKVSYRNLSASSVTLKSSEGTWITYSAYKEKTPQGVEYVDLGLPSGTLWATCNVGGTKPEDYGDYFAWGETVPYGKEDSTNENLYNATGSYTKNTFSWNTYKWGNGTVFSKYKSGDEELEPQDDAAYAHWGAGWCMPTIEQFQEFGEYTTYEWTTQNGVYGYLITSKANGNSIFLPAAGYRDGSSLNDGGKDGDYWARTLGTSFTSRAYSLYFYSGYIGTYIYDRYNGQSIRPVRRLPRK